MGFREKMVDVSVRLYRRVITVIAVVTLLVAVLAVLPSLLPSGRLGPLEAVEVDTDPENMLPEDEPARVFHNRMKELMNLHDMVVVGVVNDGGLFNPLSLHRVYELTEYSRTFRWRSEKSPDQLEGLVEKDLMAPSTVDKTVPKGGEIDFDYLMREPPLTEQEAKQVLADSKRVPFLAGTLIAKDGKAAAVYIPLTRKDLSHKVYYNLKERLPVLWQWASVELGIRRLDSSSQANLEARRRVLQVGREAAFFAPDPTEFSKQIELLGGLCKGEGDPEAKWEKAASRVREYLQRAEALDGKYREELEQSAQERNKELRARWALAAHAAFLEFLRNEEAGSPGPSVLRFARYHAQSLRLSDMTASERVREVAGWLEENSSVLADCEPLGRGIIRVASDAVEAHGDFPDGDNVHITGLPVAEDTFGVEMFKQMAISAPLAMLIIFCLMLVFFRQFALVASSMVVAVISVVFTMGALIISGFPVHIMSSMIPIFIMPIAVLDSIHMLSEFFEKYQLTKDRSSTIQSVVHELFAPMLYTSLTSAAGFASLALTPIPPVQVFGVYVAAGILVAWVVTMIFIPAFVMTLKPASLENFGAARTSGAEVSTPFAGVMRGIGRTTYRRAKLILALGCVVVVIAVWGISKIVVNDNPVKWFTKSHPIRVADRVFNDHFGGTYMAYLTMEAEEGEFEPEKAVSRFQDELKKKLGALDDSYAQEVLSGLRQLAQDAAAGRKTKAAFYEKLTEAVDKKRNSEDEAEAPAAPAEGAGEGGGPALPEGLGATGGGGTPSEGAEAPGEGPGLPEGLGEEPGLPPGLGEEGPSLEQTGKGESSKKKELWDRIAGFVDEKRQELQVFKTPRALAYIGKLQEELREVENADEKKLVGKSNSFTDIIKTVYRDLRAQKPRYDIDPKEDPLYTLPGTPAGVAACVMQYENSHRPHDLWHFVTPDYRRANIWIQLRSGDNRDMKRVKEAVAAFVKQHPPPKGVLAEPEWFGLTNINVIWQRKMVNGMLEAFAGSFLVVFLLMTLLFRSSLWGILCMIPLTVTIGAIYGAVGITGKDYDMPVAVLSSLTLGLAVDFAIHFLARSRHMYQSAGSWFETFPRVFGEPARAIVRNIIVIAAGFLPLVLAPLVPYKTVGIFLATILLFSGVGTLLLLPAMVRLLEEPLFRPSRAERTCCHCVTCITSAGALAGLVVLNLNNYLSWGWNGMVFASLAIIAGFAAVCYTVSRGKRCAQPAENEESQ